MFGFLILAACNNSGTASNSGFSEPPQSNSLTSCADTDSCFSNPTLEIGGDRPAQVQIPVDYTTTTRYPLIILLHGFGSTGALQSSYFGLDVRVDTRQYVLVVPDGSENANGKRFWNATPACCAFSAAELQIDDVAYLRGLIAEAAATYSIDTGRIGLMGSSNGGFMALRMACEASDLVASVVSLAGSTFAEDASCTPAANPVSVLTLHGDADASIFYAGRQNGVLSYPGAQETIARFAAHAGCDSSNPITAPALDAVDSIEGAETAVLKYPDCAAGVDVELWTLVGAPHTPLDWLPGALDAMVGWLTDHRRQ